MHNFIGNLGMMPSQKACFLGKANFYLPEIIAQNIFFSLNKGVFAKASSFIETRLNKASSKAA
jgi:hypothetical protein